MENLDETYSRKSYICAMSRREDCSNETFSSTPKSKWIKKGTHNDDWLVIDAACVQCIFRWASWKRGHFCPWCALPGFHCSSVIHRDYYIILKVSNNVTKRSLLRTWPQLDGLSTKESYLMQDKAKIGISPLSLIIHQCGIYLLLR